MKLTSAYSVVIAVLALAGISYVSGQTSTSDQPRSFDQRSSDRGSQDQRQNRRRFKQTRSYAQGRSYGQGTVPGPEDYAAFSQFIAVRNIFNPDRYPIVAGRPIMYNVPKPSKSAPGFSFVGTMVYGKGIFAFFDGNDDDYRKSLQVSGTIAGFTVQEITLGHVILAEGSNTLSLAVGTVMRQARDGSWVQTDEYPDFSSETVSSGGSTAPAAAATDSPAAPSAPPAEMSDILKKLMKLREQENK